jgi:hypothetical protein
MVSGTCQHRSQSSSASTPRFVVGKLRISTAAAPGRYLMAPAPTCAMRLNR